MGHGKYQKIRRTVPAVRWTLVILAVLGLTVGGVAAYLSTSAGSVENTFAAAAPTDPVIVETFTENASLVKENVRVNVGDPGYAVYIRAAVVVTWRDDAGNVLAQTPVKDTDYTISMGEAWFAQDGFWYCKTMVNSGDSPVLINECTVTAQKGDYHLHVEIIAQTIQALGTTDGDAPIPAVQDAWGVYVTDNGQLSATAPATS